MCVCVCVCVCVSVCLSVCVSNNNINKCNFEVNNVTTRDQKASPERQRRPAGHIIIISSFNLSKMAQYKIKQCIKATRANRLGTGRLRTALTPGLKSIQLIQQCSYSKHPCAPLRRSQKYVHWRWSNEHCTMMRHRLTHRNSWTPFRNYQLLSVQTHQTVYLLDLILLQYTQMQNCHPFVLLLKITIFGVICKQKIFVACNNIVYALLINISNVSTSEWQRRFSHRLVVLQRFQQQPPHYLSREQWTWNISK